MRRNWMYLCILIFLTTDVGICKDSIYFHEVNIRTGFLTLTNTGTQSGSASGGSGININYNLFLSEKVCISLGYETSFDLATQSIPVTGYILGGRYYYKGLGTRSIYEGVWGSSDYQSLLAGYVGASLGMYEYFLGKDNLSIDVDSANLEGRYMNINLITGADYKVNARYELNGELGYSVFAFAASDNRVKLNHLYAYFGITFSF